MKAITMVWLGVAGMLGMIAATIYAIIHTLVPDVYYTITGAVMFGIGIAIWWDNHKNETQEH